MAAVAAKPPKRKPTPRQIDAANRSSKRGAAPSSVTNSTGTIWEGTNTYEVTTNCNGTAPICNNGNVLAQNTVNTANNGTTTYQQAFTYDGFNRLKTAGETNAWKQVYSYDQWGNRAVLMGTQYYIPNSGLTPQVATDSPASVTAVFPGNRWSGGGYDNGVSNGAGSMTSVSGYTFTYDGEYRLLSSTLGGATTSYTYDGDGRRVMKTAAGGSRTLYVYSVLGDVAAEYSDTANPDPGTRYVTVDQLGSTRLVTDATGTCKETHDYLPFGEEIGSPYRTGCYTTGYTTQKFTAKERDTESGNDYFDARYMASSMGRFLSPDPSNLSVDWWLPQTWNRYSYALNNPLTVVDKNGLWPTYVHNNIIDEAFPGMSKEDLQNLKDSSFVMDFGAGQQDPSNAYMHGMSDGSGQVFYGGGNEQHAWEQAENYIGDQIQAAQEAQANWIAQGHSGFSPLALSAFGNALHTTEDRLSPAHRGEQPWANKPWWHYTT